MISNLELQSDNFHKKHTDPGTQSKPLQSSLRNLSKLLEYNISDLTPRTLTKHKKRLYQLATFADISRVQIHFHGLEELKKKYEMHFCQNWDSEDDYPIERELYDLLSNIQMQSNVSPRKYDIKVVD
ncbi:MAG: hypothetical protein ACW99A_13560 [Candidatus Kariarchaeaceae archaeon]|jgi:hypothetical protein